MNLKRWLKSYQIYNKNKIYNIHEVLLHISKLIFMFVSELKINIMKHLPKIVKETAMDMVLDMHSLLNTKYLL